ncbi:MAG: CDP-alcohol phosphatidyltransferase family protein [Gammaproteobacteria bacterium]|jgi:cardiolipin synthase|nr:CDP-alcohol phosphatidyltransferase family protein [Gammaproteobacteria bacterium]
MSLGWLPNAISLMRIVLVAPILMLILDGQFDWALLLFCIAGFSDGLDGYLAMRFDWSTRLGGLLDPTADKLLVTGLFVTLAWIDLIPVWLAIVVILRDVVIVAGAIAYNFIVKPVPGEPSRISKLNTALQMLFVVFVLSRAAFDWPDKITITVLGASILVTVVISGVDYVWSWSRRAREG